MISCRFTYCYDRINRTVDARTDLVRYIFNAVSHLGDCFKLLLEAYDGYDRGNEVSDQDQGKESQYSDLNIKTDMGDYPFNDRVQHIDTERSSDTPIDSESETDISAEIQFVF